MNRAYQILMSPTFGGFSGGVVGGLIGEQLMHDSDNPFFKLYTGGLGMAFGGAMGSMTPLFGPMVLTTLTIRKFLM